MSARSTMTMRALVKRNLHQGVDEYGQQAQGWQLIAGAQPCRVWASRGAQVIRATGEVSIDSPGAIFPRDADVRIGDRLEEVRDRREQLLFSRLEVTAVDRRADHWAATLRSVDA